MLNPLRDPQDERPAAYCDRCLGEIFSGESMVLYEGQWLCPDCFQADIEKILRENMSFLAQEMQLDTISL